MPPGTPDETALSDGMFNNACRALQAFPSFIVIDASCPSEQLVEDVLQELRTCGLGLQ